MHSTVFQAWVCRYFLTLGKNFHTSKHLKNGITPSRFLLDSVYLKDLEAKRVSVQRVARIRQANC